MASHRYGAIVYFGIENAMHAMVLTAPGAPLQFQQRNDPTLRSGAVRIKVGACGVCRNDLDGELPGTNYPIVPGDEVVGTLVPLALRAVRKGGRVVCAGIHMSNIPSFPYNILWEERQLLSVANLTRSDGVEFFKVATRARIKTHTTVFPLREANEVLSKLRSRQITGAAVLQP